MSEVPLEAASEMLGCHKHHLRNVLLTRRLSAGSGEVTKRRGQGRSEMLTVPLDRDQAGMARNSLIKEVRKAIRKRENTVNQSDPEECSTLYPNVVKPNYFDDSLLATISVSEPARCREAPDYQSDKMQTINGSASDYVIFQI